MTANCLKQYKVLLYKEQDLGHFDLKLDKLKKKKEKKIIFIYLCKKTVLFALKCN